MAASERRARRCFGLARAVSALARSISRARAGDPPGPAPERVVEGRGVGVAEKGRDLGDGDAAVEARQRRLLAQGVDQQAERRALLPGAAAGACACSRRGIGQCPPACRIRPRARPSGRGADASEARRRAAWRASARSTCAAKIAANAALACAMRRVEHGVVEHDLGVRGPEREGAAEDGAVLTSTAGGDGWRKRTTRATWGWPERARTPSAISAIAHSSACRAYAALGPGQRIAHRGRPRRRGTSSRALAVAPVALVPRPCARWPRGSRGWPSRGAGPASKLVRVPHVRRAGAGRKLSSPVIAR